MKRTYWRKDLWVTKGVEDERYMEGLIKIKVGSGKLE